MTNIFQRGGPTTNQICWLAQVIVPRCLMTQRRAEGVFQQQLGGLQAAADPSRHSVIEMNWVGSTMDWKHQTLQDPTNQIGYLLG